MKANKNKSIKYSILIVDDDRDVLDLIEEVLSDNLYVIETEQDPYEAVKKLKNKNYDIIITDLMMPGLDGMQLISIVKDTNSDSRIIVITGHATINTAIQALQLGVFDYVHKPINHVEIKTLVKKAVENLSLSRNNKLLHEKNERILSNLSLLIDISKILFQVNNINHAFDMVLDTMTDYFKLEKCAIFMEDIETGVFEAVSSRNIDKGIKNLKFKSSQKLNNCSVSIEKETILKIENEILLVGKEQISCKNGKIILFPVSFQDVALGYLLVHVSESEMPSRELLPMINILALQVAPIMSMRNKTQEKPDLQTNITYLVRDQIEKAENLLSPISFGLLRTEFFSPSGDSFAYKNLISTVQDYISENVPDEFVLYWQSKDTALLIMPEVDYFKAETFCKNLKKLIENVFKPSENSAKVSIKFSCLGYPEAGNTATEIADHLWAKLFQEINFCENDHVINT